MMTDLRTLARHLRPIETQVENESLNWKLLKAYLNLAKTVEVTISTVSISFDSKTKADEFRKFVMAAKRGGV